MKFNINDYVKVKLTTRGRKLHRENWEKYFAGTGFDYTPPPEDPFGWTRWQFWSLMHEFGEQMYMGPEPPFETTIEIIEKQG